MMRILLKEQYLIILFLFAQIIYWHGIPYEIGNKAIWQGSKSIKPELGIVPALHSDILARTLSFGDEQFYFRVMGYQIQNAGDSFGRSTPLKDYDYAKLEKWWDLLDSIDPVSDFIPSLASYYYGATQNPKEQLPYVVNYLERHADRDPIHKWWWYSQAIYHSKTILGDTERALSIAEKLYNLPKDVKVPIWVREIKAFIHEDRGEYKEACQIIFNIADGYDDLTEGEKNFIDYFINDRLKDMEKHYDDVDLDPRCKAIIDNQRKQRGSSQ